LSFFDDDDGETRPPAARPAAATARTRAQPRRPQRTGGSGGAGGSRQTDRHSMMVRRRVAVGAGLVALIVIALVVKSCMNSGREEALREYNRDAGRLVTESDQQVSRPFFATLAGASGKSPLDVQSAIDQQRVLAAEQAARAKSLSVPGEMGDAQRYLTLVLDLREEGLAKIATLVRTALGGQGKRASTLIAGDMEMFLTSDVIWSQRTAPLIQQTLAADGIHGEATPGTQFLANLGWLDPETVLARLTGKSASSGQSGQIAPGTHGSALTGVSVGSTTLEAPPTLNHIAGGANPTFTVNVENSGTNPETNVKVEVAVTAGGKQFTASKAIDKTEPGATVSVDIPVEGVPQKVAARVSVNIQPVPGETDSENNKGSFLAVFGQ
jgi:hypothetical protein